MQERISPSNFRYSFDSIREAVLWIEDTTPTWRDRESVDAHAYTDWDLNAGYRGALDMARDGWIEGAQDAATSLQSFQPATYQPAKRAAVAGSIVSPSRYAAGNPRCMIRRHREGTRGSGRILSLYVAVNAVGDVGATYMRNYGLAVAQYINQLEQAGTRVELHAGFCSSKGNQWMAHSFKLKDAGQPLDLAAVAFAIGHPAMFRRIGFALRERSAAHWGGAYGGSIQLTLDHLINAPSGAICLNGMQYANQNARTPEKALEYVSMQIEKALMVKEGVI